MVKTRNKKQKIEKTIEKKIVKNKKSIKFNNIKYIYNTYSSNEYDRSSIKVGDDFNYDVNIINYKDNNTFNNDFNNYLNNNFDSIDNIDILKNICDIKYEIDLLTYFKNN